MAAVVAKTVGKKFSFEKNSLAGERVLGFGSSRAVDVLISRKTDFL